jgi:hypothetical protein
MFAGLVVAAEEHLRDLPVDPIVIGATVFLIFTILMVGLLMYGKGRPHA